MQRQYLVLALVLALMLAMLVLPIIGTYAYREARREGMADGGGADGGAGADGAVDDDGGKFYWKKPDTRQLSCVVAGPSGQRYCVRDTKRKADSAALIASVAETLVKFVARLVREHPYDRVAARLRDRFEPERMMETLPNIAYTAYAENKGEKIALCLTPVKDSETGGLIDEHTLTFVALHELAHVGTASTADHGPEFWNNYRFLLENARDQGVHDPVDYKKNPVTYCSMVINDNPLFTKKQ